MKLLCLHCSHLKISVGSCLNRERNYIILWTEHKLRFFPHDKMSNSWHPKLINYSSSCSYYSNYFSFLIHHFREKLNSLSIPHTMSRSKGSLTLAFSQRQIQKKGKRGEQETTYTSFSSTSVSIPESGINWTTVRYLAVRKTSGCPLLLCLAHILVLTELSSIYKKEVGEHRNNAQLQHNPPTKDFPFTNGNFHL